MLKHTGDEDYVGDYVPSPDYGTPNSPPFLPPTYPNLSKQTLGPTPPSSPTVTHLQQSPLSLSPTPSPLPPLLPPLCPSLQGATNIPLSPQGTSSNQQAAVINVAPAIPSAPSHAGTTTNPTPSHAVGTTPSPPPTSVTQSPTLPWTETLTDPTIYPFQPPSPVGPTVPIPDTPLGVFRLLFTEQLLDTIVKETNQYALQVLGPAKFTAWTPTDREEVAAYTGFQFMMGLSPKPSLYDYWRRNPLFHYPPIADKISRNR